MEGASSNGGEAVSSGDKGLVGNIKWLVTVLAIPVVLAYLAHVFSEMETNRASEDRRASDTRALADSRLKVYTELLNKREEADMGVRSQIFSTLLGNYLNPIKGDLPRRMTVLELLASNFDESLNLSPLFWHIDAEISAGRGPEFIALRSRLSSLATEVKAHQIDVLSASGDQASWDITLRSDSLNATLPTHVLRFKDPSASKNAASAACSFDVSVIEWDSKKRRVFVVVKTSLPTASSSPASPCWNPETKESRLWSFWVDEFDFPLITFTRLSERQRFALVLSRYSESQHSATIDLVFFPSSRGGARDRPFLDTVVESLNAPADAGTPSSNAPRGSN